MESQHIARARAAKLLAAEWAVVGHTDKVAQWLRVASQEVWLARRARRWHSAKK